MMIELLAGFALGGLGAVGHLAFVRLRVARLIQGEPAPPQILGLAAPAAAVFVAIAIAREATWAVPVGLFAARLVLLRRRARG